MSRALDMLSAQLLAALTLHKFLAVLSFHF